MPEMNVRVRSLSSMRVVFDSLATPWLPMSML